MFSFGKTKVRSLETFGIAGVLSPEAEVFYSAVFSTRHIGRISDLLSARMRRGGVSEVKLRALLVFCFFQAYRGQWTKRPGFRIFARAGDDGLDTPIFMECGIDSEKIALGLTFNLKKGLQLSGDGLAARIFNGEPQSPFEEMMVGVQENSHRMIVKYQPLTRRVELIALMGIEGKIDAASIQAKMPLELLIIEREDIKNAPRPRLYLDLGDMDYSKLLKVEAREKHYRPPETGEFLLPGESLDSTKEVQVEKRLRPESETGQVAKEKSQPEAVKVVAGSGGDLQSSDVIVVPGGADKAKLPAYGNLGVAGLESRGIFGKAKMAVGRFLLRMMGIDLNGSQQMEAQTTPDSTMPELPALGGDSGGPDMNDANIDLSKVTGEAGNAGIQSRKLLFELRVGGIERLVRRLQREVVSMKVDIKNPNAVEWVETAIAALASERTRIHEQARKVDLAIRVKDLDHKTQLGQLQEEVKRRDAQISTKNTAYLRVKEQLALLESNTEKMKILGQSGSEDGQSKQKNGMTQRMLTIAKEENERLTQRVESLEKQISASQAGSKGSSNPNVDPVALQEKYDKLQKQLEELKNSNRQLVELVDSAKKNALVSPGGDSVDLAKRLETSVKLVNTHRKEIETLKLRVADLEQELDRLKMAA